MAKSNSDSSGCLALIGIIGIIVLVVYSYDGSKKSRANSQDRTISSQNSSNAQQQSRTIDYQDKEILSEDDKKYLNNSLYTGATPYSQYYGNNYKCPYDQCSGIRVTAPHGSDILVIIKRNNQNGKVIAHGYICSGATYQFDLPDGTYQTFFYYGEGWNPNKVMKGEVKGGFIKNELFSKDNPQEIYSGVLSYVLQLQRNGNFQTRGSNKSECF